MIRPFGALFIVASFLIFYCDLAESTDNIEISFEKWAQHDRDVYLLKDNVAAVCSDMRDLLRL